jgi:hypothetical protein
MDIWDVIMPATHYPMLVGACAAIGAATAVWRVLIRVKEEADADMPDRQFSYYDVLDAVHAAVWGGVIGGVAIVAAPVSLPVFAAMRAARESEERSPTVNESTHTFDE